MTALRRPRARPQREPTIALINVVFLMLIFFLIAGTVAPPLDGDVELVRTEALEGRAPPGAAVIGPDGALRYLGAVLTPEAFAARAGPEPRLVPDRALPAARLMQIVRALREAGAERVWLVTERGLE